MNTGESLSGITFDLEPAVRINYYTVSFFRFESILASDSRENNTSRSMDAYSISLGGQYYLFERGRFPFYAGIGLGFYYPYYSEESRFQSGYNQTISSVELSSDRRNLFYPRIGFDFGHFNLLVDFNLIPSSEGIKRTSFYNNTTRISYSSYEDIEINNSYISFKLGFSLGGGSR